MFLEIWYRIQRIRLQRMSDMLVVCSRWLSLRFSKAVE